MKGVEQPPQFHPEGDVFVHTLLLLDNLPPAPPATLAWGALLHDVGKPATFRVAPDRIRFDGHVEVGVKMAEEILHRLRFSNDDSEQIVALVKNHMRFADATRMKESTLKKFIRMPRFEEHLDLHRMDCQSSQDDLIAAGYEPGPRFKEILTAIEDAQLEGTLQNKEEAKIYVQRNFPK
jgi:poly(A) polymerase